MLAASVRRPGPDTRVRLRKQAERHADLRIDIMCRELSEAVEADRLSSMDMAEEQENRIRETF